MTTSVERMTRVARWPRLQQMLALVPQKYTAHAIACVGAASERREEAAPLALSRSGPLQQTAPKYKHTVGCSDSPEGETSQLWVLQCNLTCAFHVSACSA